MLAIPQNESNNRRRLAETPIDKVTLNTRLTPVTTPNHQVLTYGFNKRE